MAITGKKVNWILDADIEGLCDAIDHKWLIKFLEHRIGDRRILRLIRKWLRAGIMEEGKWSETTAGSPQGSVTSPLLSNVYLHYVFDLWIQWWRKHHLPPRCGGAPRGRSRWTWERMHRLVRRHLPRPRIVHPYQDQRLRVGLKAGTV